MPLEGLVLGSGNTLFRATDNQRSIGGVQGEGHGVTCCHLVLGHQLGHPLQHKLTVYFILDLQGPALELEFVDIVEDIHDCHAATLTRHQVRQVLDRVLLGEVHLVLPHLGSGQLLLKQRSKIVAHALRAGRRHRILLPLVQDKGEAARGIHAKRHLIALLRAGATKNTAGMLDRVVSALVAAEGHHAHAPIKPNGLELALLPRLHNGEILLRHAPWDVNLGPRVHPVERLPEQWHQLRRGCASLTGLLSDQGCGDIAMGGHTVGLGCGACLMLPPPALGADSVLLHRGPICHRVERGRPRTSQLSGKGAHRRSGSMLLPVQVREPCGLITLREAQEQLPLPLLLKSSEHQLTL
mmetsp:Transcript_19035/g.49771  ORF Transcript_19035/g.49771 Transcript_19035/m.49771 type:complete len:354 (-) Transcript_19035:408-1469(-)